MSYNRYILFLLITIVSVTARVTAQEYTPYDEMPGIIKSYKPAYDPGYPEWGRQLYRYPVNYNEISRNFSNYIKQNPGEKSAIIRYFRIWNRAIEPYVLPDGTIQLNDMQRYREGLLQEQIEAALVQKSISTKGSEWSFLGPKETFWLNESNDPETPGACPWQVNIYSFDVAATDNNILYCGTETGYINKSTDKGISWEQSGAGYPFGGSVTAIAIDPADADIVYAAAGDQVHKTIDGGITWLPLLGPDRQFHADRLKIDGDNSNKIIAATTTGIKISVDGGENWVSSWGYRVYDIDIKPGDSNTIYAIARNSSNNFTILVSVNGGVTFNTISTFPSAIADISGGLLAVTPANPALLFAVMLSSNNTPYIYRGQSSSGIWSWTRLATGNTSSLAMNNGQGYFDLVLDVSPVDQNIIFAGTTTLYKSVNGGSTFTPVGGYQGDFAIHPDIQDIKLLPSGESWVSTDGGMILTTDNFSNTANYFARINGLIGSDMWGFDQGWNEDIVVGGRYHNGNTAIADFYQPKALRMGGAESPTGWVLQGKSRHVAFNDLGNGWILPETATGAPEGRFIFSKYPNMDEYGGRRSNLVHHPNYYGVLFLGEGNSFWRSDDMGSTYDLLYSFPDRVRYLQVSYSNPDIFYADIVNYGLFRSSDGGKSWVRKPTLTGGGYGNSYWNGKLNFAISPGNENILYACLQNGTWSEDIGSVYLSQDGGDTWQNYTGSLSEYTKCLVVQPDDSGNDIVYLFSNSRKGGSSGVFYRKSGMNDWEVYDINYPAGMDVNMALPFFRDSKIRSAGSAGVWEAPMVIQNFKPVINPWVEKPAYNCMLDTLYFDDHSILNHDGATWEWVIEPEPLYIDNPGIRNPKVVLGTPGAYSVTLKVSQGGELYSRTISNMVTTTTCPSIDDCSNPADIPREEWTLLYTDSQEDDGPAVNTFDNDNSTIWHTEWKYVSPGYPHEIQIDMGKSYLVNKITLLPRQVGINGRIKDYELYVSNNKIIWGDYVKKGQFENSSGPQIVKINPKIGRYIRLRALSEQNNNIWASLAEINVEGCIDITNGLDHHLNNKYLKAFPVPTDGIVFVSLPADATGRNLNFSIVSAAGKILQQGSVPGTGDVQPFDLTSFDPGIYYIILTDSGKTNYRIKIIRAR